jgi:hypothetical protein
VWGQWIARCGGMRKGGDSRPYGVYPCCMKSLVTQLSNIIIKFKKKCILEDSYLHHRDDVLLAMH